MRSLDLDCRLDVQRSAAIADKVIKFIRRMRSAGRSNGHLLVGGVVYTYLLSSAFLAGSSLAKTISGRVEKCFHDGERVNVPILGKDSCYRCYCRKGRVECESNKCPSLEGCHAILFTRPKGHCCNVCKGCLVGESYLTSGDAWSSVEDNCIINICQAGVVTSSRQMCRPPCQDAAYVPGQCCPVCKGCYHDSVEHLDGEIFTLKHSPSVQCVCKQGNTTCSKRLCPVLNCPEGKIYFDRGQRCPRCKGQRMVFDTPRSCFFAKRVFANGERHTLDNCTSCTCVHGTMICDRQQCPELACPRKDQMIGPGLCCPACKQRLTCRAGNVTVQHNETWQPDKCTTCTCQDGVARCAPKWCSHTSICQEGYRLRYREDQCCPVCTRNDGVCSVRGQASDVIDTLDGKTYTLDGFCTHDLIRDCRHAQLTVKVKYKTKVGLHKHIDVVTIRFGSTSIKLYKSSEIRINRTNLFSNHFSSTNFSLKIHHSQIIVKVKAGLNVNWNLNDRLSIKVSGNYFQSGSLCGLCGDFDGDHSNDLMNKKGHQVEDPSLMASAWVRGKLCRQHLYKTDGSSSVDRKQSLNRYQYHKRRLFVKHGLHHHQTGLMGLSRSVPNKKLQMYGEITFNYSHNGTSETSFNSTASLFNYSSTSEYSETSLTSGYSEIGIDAKETSVPSGIENENIKNVTEDTVPAQFNTSSHDAAMLSPAKCQTIAVERLQAQDYCQKISNLKLDKCGDIFEEVSFVRSCTDVICACQEDEMCMKTAINYFLLPCRASHDITKTPSS
ncbi:hypothetical protein BsWGS_26760 [Bradybaena similaris]